MSDDGSVSSESWPQRLAARVMGILPAVAWCAITQQHEYAMCWTEATDPIAGCWQQCMNCRHRTAGWTWTKRPVLTGSSGSRSRAGTDAHAE